MLVLNTSNFRGANQTDSPETETLYRVNIHTEHASIFKLETVKV